jgi:ribonuclease-3
MHGHGIGRSKKEAEQQAAESAYRTLSEEYGDLDADRDLSA